MNRIEKVNVSIKWSDKEILVGQLIREDRKIYFKYDEGYLNEGHNISPLKLSFDNQIQLVDTGIFEGLYGVFSDSLPDGWGRLLVDRYLSNKGISIGNIGALERLTIVGSAGQGALIYAPEMEDDSAQIEDLELDSLHQSALEIYDSMADVELDAMYKLGGSSGGARPKVELLYNDVTKTFEINKPDASEGYDAWIIKFPSSQDIVDIAKIEYAYYLMAKKAKITMSECRLFEGKSGTKYFGTKRFDRASQGRKHMISAAGLLHDNYRYTSIDYGHLMDAAFRLTTSYQSYEDVLRLGIFNVLSHNKDDHSKNFSFLMDEDGKWSFSPAYDLTYSTSNHGYQSMSVGGESKRPMYRHFKSLADDFGVKNLDQIVDDVMSTLEAWTTIAHDLEMDDNTQSMINKSFLELKSSFQA